MEEVVVAALRHESKKVFKLGAKLLRRCLESLLGSYVTEFRCMKSDLWRQEGDRGKALHLLQSVVCCWFLG